MKSFASFATCILALTISIAQAQQPQKSKPRHLTVSGGVLQGTALKKVSPPYPPIARAARAAGKVQVQVTISEQGEVIEAIAISGHPLLRDAAVDAAKQWVFMPTELSGVPVKVQGILTFNFTLVEDDSKESDIVPRDAQGYLTRGKARRANGDEQGAIADFTKAIELDPQFFDAYFQRVIARINTDPDGGLADANKLIEINPSSSDAYFARGSVRMLKLDLDGSVADLSKAIEFNPQSPHAWFFRGIARKNKRDLDGSVADLSKAIELNPIDFDAYKARGAARLKKGDLPGAIADFDKAIGLYPDDPEAYNGRGQARLDKGDKAGALADFNKAISLDPNFGWAYFNRAFIHGDNGAHDKATADFVRANEDPRFKLQLGFQDGLSRKLEEEEVNQAIAANSRDAPAYRRRAGLRMIKGDLDGAIADHTKAIELEPRDAKSYDNRGVLLMSKDDLDGAIADFTKAIELDSKSALFYANRGMALLSKGKEAEAQSDFDRCLKLNPSFKPDLERQIKAIKEQRAKPNR